MGIDPANVRSSRTAIATSAQLLGQTALCGLVVQIWSWYVANSRRLAGWAQRPGSHRPCRTGACTARSGAGSGDTGMRIACDRGPGARIGFILGLRDRKQAVIGFAPGVMLG